MSSRKQIREAPAAQPSFRGTHDPAFPDVLNRIIPPPEPEFAVDNIQGNIIGGFNKDFQTLIFLDIRNVNAFRRWLSSQITFVSTAAKVISFNRMFKAERFRSGVEIDNLKATWFNLAFSHQALTDLGAIADDDFQDEAFKQGLLERSRQRILGDPSDDDNLPGSPKNWVIGGENNEADVILIIAADGRRDMLNEVARLELSLGEFKSDGGEPCAQIIFKEEGTNLPPPLSGHEHFGFLDGVSQPGLRGRISDQPNDVLMPRQVPDKRDQPPCKNSQGKLEAGRAAQGKSGQDLLWPGEFVFGYQEQDPQENNEWEGPNPIPNPIPPLIDPDSQNRRTDLTGIAPAWARDGSFLVFRRLRQEVFAFHCFLHQVAHDLRVPDPKAYGPVGENDHAACLGSSKALVGARLVGRWPSGAPVVRTPDHDDPAMADNDCRNNNFEFGSEGDEDAPDRPDLPDCISDQPGPSPLDCKPSEEQDGDPEGVKCPFSGHVRKAYPRNDKPEFEPVSDQPVPDPCDARRNLSESNTQTHRILRRGIPFGPVSASTPDAPVNDDPLNGRGLHFLGYMTSIVDQFEFVTRCWINNPDFKEPFGNVGTEANKRGGHDPIIGQNDMPGQNRRREFTVTFHDADGKAQSERVSTQTEWVIPTGGGYFFSPSISGLTHLSGQED